MEIVSRQAAIAACMKYYFTGEPCNLGGFSLRTVIDKKCQCEAHIKKRADSASKLYLKNREYRLDKQKSYSANNQEKVAAYRREHYQRNKDAYIQRAADWSLSNTERRREITREWAARNLGNLNLNVNISRAKRFNAIPRWFGELDRLVMEEAYSLAKMRTSELGFAWEVDHIVPFAGKTACCLHVAANIQVIPLTLNRRKSNRVDQFRMFFTGVTP